MTRPRVTAVRLVRARSSNGLLGYISCTVGPVRLDSLTLRRRRDGSLGVSYPCRRDRQGRRHYLVRPTGPALERAILTTLGRRGDLP